MQLTLGSLFSGIDGLALGLRRAGMDLKWQVEIDDWCQRLNAQHDPDIPRFGDIRSVGAHNLTRVDVLCGGPPCQPVSTAGARKGQEDARWLWPEYMRLLRELRPRYAVMENVPGLLTKGFAEVLAELAESGFDAEWDCLPASAFGAPHRRDRVFIVAYPMYEGSSRTGGGDEYQSTECQSGNCDSEDVADTECSGLQGCSGSGIASARRASEFAPCDGETLADTDNARLQGHRRLRERPRKLSAWEDGETIEGGRIAPPGIRRVAHGVPDRVHRLKALGNAVVPQVAEFVGTCILNYERERDGCDLNHNGTP